jgi:hypothetical protein
MRSIDLNMVRSIIEQRNSKGPAVRNWAGALREELSVDQERWTGGEGENHAWN